MITTYLKIIIGSLFVSYKFLDIVSKNLIIDFITNLVCCVECI